MTRNTKPDVFAIGLLTLALAVYGGVLWAADEETSLAGLDGGRLTVAELAERDTVIVVWASWSPRSRGVGASIAALADRWGGRARVLTINFQEDPEKARAFARKERITVPVFLDPDAAFAKRYAVTSLPFLLVLEDGETAFAGRFPADPDAVITRALE